MSELEEASIARAQKSVRGVFPGAKLRTDGFMYWVEVGPVPGHEPVDKEIISRRMTTPGRAWKSALEFAAAR